MNKNENDTKLLREYPDWMRLLPKRFYEIIRNGDEWHFYYNMDWENCLIFGVILHNKDYLIEGGMPNWFKHYIEEYEVIPFDYNNNDVKLVFYKEKWVRNTITFHLEDKVTESGMIYNVSSVISPSPEFLENMPAPGRDACPNSVWHKYVLKHMDRIKEGNEWNPEKK